MKRKLFYCCFMLLLVHGCSLFNPQEPEAFGDVEVQLRFAEAPSMAGEADAQAFAKGNQHQRAQALDRFAISIFSYTPQLEEAGRELVRREIVVGEQRRLSVAVRVPLRSAPEDYFLAEVKAFQRGDLIYSGTDVFQFNDTTKTATVEILLYPVDFSASFFLQSGLPRFVLGQAFVFDTSTTISAFDFEGNGITVTAPLGRANQASNAILLWGDTTITKIRARRHEAFRGEITGRYAYPGPAADVLIACTWNQPVDFNLEIINPQGQPISEVSPGDVPEGSGAFLISSGAYGPEVFEWRVGRITGGQFIVNVTRQNGGALGSGTVYVIRREARADQTVDKIPFDFRPSDTQNTKQVFTFIWP